MEKRNVMKTGVLWNEVVTQVHLPESFPTFQLEHVLANSGGMQLVRSPTSTSSSPTTCWRTCSPTLPRC